MARGDIRDPKKAQDSRCNWSWLNPAWGNTRISPTDVDFEVERKGKFLTGEIKTTRDGLTQGQTILLQAKAKIPQFTVFVLVGDITENEIWPKEMMVVGQNEWHPVDRADFLAFCMQWFQAANRA
jgi:hypothetical protein